ncbi:uncharacterized protein LOC131194114 [Ahaetulla prasina]|uniref:uncharacterized protein LOC131194114 n=1 Tax=Ahaetulla prasina TaxID=499056 RepID=UPI0026492453|nr:uncharacterized protein LOC131194114 [Ahaetulla prasina]
MGELQKVAKLIHQAKFFYQLTRCPAPSPEVTPKHREEGADLLGPIPTDKTRGRGQAARREGQGCCSTGAQRRRKRWLAQGGLCSSGLCLRRPPALAPSKLATGDHEAHPAKLHHPTNQGAWRPSQPPAFNSSDYETANGHAFSLGCSLHSSRFFPGGLVSREAVHAFGGNWGGLGDSSGEKRCWKGLLSLEDTTGISFQPVDPVQTHTQPTPPPQAPARDKLCKGARSGLASAKGTIKAAEAPWMRSVVPGYWQLIIATLLIIANLRHFRCASVINPAISIPRSSSFVSMTFWNLRKKEARSISKYIDNFRISEPSAASLKHIYSSAQDWTRF